METALLKRDTLGLRLVTIALIAAVTLLLLPYLTGLIGAGVLYVVANPLVRRIDPGRWRKTVAFATIVVLFVIIVIPGLWMLAEVLAQLPDAARSIQRSAAVERLMAMRLGDVQVGNYLRTASSEIIAWSSRQTMSALGGMMTAMLNLVIALFGAYYLLISADRLWETARATLPFAPMTSEVLRVRFHRTTEAMLLGVVLTGLAQGTLVGLLFRFMGLAHPLLWGTVTAFASVLPMFGSAVVWFPAALVLVAQDRFVAASVMASIGLIVVSNIDNVLRLLVYRRVSQIHPMVTLVGAFAGVSAFGFAGVLIGPLILSYLIELYKVHRAPPDLHTLGAAA